MALVPRKKADLQSAVTEVLLSKQIGAGGNGVVYSGEHSTLGQVAVKFMLNSDKKRYDRFCDEVKVVTGLLKDSTRVLPILEAHLNSTNGVIPYYVMPTALPITKNLATNTWSDKLLACAELAEGLADIHEYSVAHRDIKPENLFFFNGTYRFGDFGIASFPEKLGLTEQGEPMGPWAYMAIEMLSNPVTADAFKADVYSLAKTVWALLTEEKVPFAGQYNGAGPESLNTRDAAKAVVTEPLELLLRDSTDSNPHCRPSAPEFAVRLRDIIQIQSDGRGNTAQWAAAESDAVSGPGLVRASWETTEHVARALGILSRRDGLNHCFYPDGGGNEVSSVSVCENGTMIAFEIPYSGKLIVKPIRLTLERFIGRPELGYAVLETEDVVPLGVKSAYTNGTSEMLRQVGDCDYVVDDSYDDEPKNSSIGAPCERRFAGGMFVFAPTSGIYNRLDDYMGTAQKMGLHDLRRLFQQYFDKMTSSNVPTLSLVPQVRLLSGSESIRQEFALEYLNISLLHELISLDDKLYVEQKSSSSRSRKSLFEAAAAEQSPAKKSLTQKLSVMTAAQLAECFALLNIGRNVLDPEQLKDNTAANIVARHEMDYVSGKFGKQFLRKSLSRFGLALVVGKVIQSSLSGN